MSYTFLQEQGEESSVASFSDIPAYVLSRLNLTAEKSCSSVSETESYRSSRSGMMLEPSTGNRGEEQLTLFAADSPVKTLAMPVMELESTEKRADYGVKWQEWFAKLDPDTSWWKTRQRYLFEDWEQSLEIWPKWGLMQDGVCLEQNTPMRFIGDTEFSFWPTPTKCDYKGATSNCKKSQGKGSYLRYFLLVRHGGHLKTHYPNPKLSEALMGWPIGHSDLKPLAMDKFQQWLSSHGIVCP